MKKRKPIWDELSEEKKRAAVEAIISFFENERGERLGVITAEEILDVAMQDTFAEIYNKGVVDAQKTMQEKMADLHIDIDLLLKK